MNATKLVPDCDLGLDDALALRLAHSDPALDFVAVTTVGGNVVLERPCQSNANCSSATPAAEFNIYADPEAVDVVPFATY